MRGMGKFFTRQAIGDINLVKFLFSELSLTETEEFKSELYGIVADPSRYFLINMKKCSFIPSIVLGILVSFNTKVRENGGKAVFCCLSKEVEAVFNVTKLNKILKICKTEEEGLNAFEPGQEG